MCIQALQNMLCIDMHPKSEENYVPTQEILPNTSDSIVHGLLREEWINLLREIIRNVDSDNVGAVSRGEFIGCLQVKYNHVSLTMEKKI